MAKKPEDSSEIDSLKEMFPSLSVGEIQKQLRSNKTIDECIPKLEELNSAAVKRAEQKKKQEEARNIKENQKKIRQLNEKQSQIVKKMDSPIGQLQADLNRVYEKSLGVLEQKIADQQAEIKQLKEVVEARDVTIEQMKKQLMEIRNLREREKSSAEVVTDIVRNIKSNVDSSFKAVQESNSIEINKLVIEVKKELAMSFLKDFKEAKQGSFTFSTMVDSKTPTEKFSLINTNASPAPTAPMDNETTLNSDNKYPLGNATAPLETNNSLDGMNPKPMPDTQNPYFPVPFQSSSSNFNYPYLPPYQYVQPSAPSFGATYESQKHT